MYAERLETTLPAVRARIARAAERAGRDPGAISLIAVTKSHPFAAVRAALDAGLRDLGENRVGELAKKRAHFGPVDDVRWHMIGPIQSRKASELPGLADLVHSVGRIKVARKLSQALEAGARIGVLAQVNTSGEDSKGGFEGARVVEEVLEVADFDGIRLEGLMTMAPFVEDEAVLRSAFCRLRETLDEVRRHDPEVGSTLSMGMTNDLEVAIEEGSTMVRIGTALFGERPGFEAR
ncbi:MAG: YggS family pyridoxal phosphate-dependent enzyme [Longimicrobiales bacterium]|nr:YggS family pyridoxal phosphate-dependent enzyme [Longimicrobiales bacterium]